MVLKSVSFMKVFSHVSAERCLGPWSPENRLFLSESGTVLCPVQSDQSSWSSTMEFKEWQSDRGERSPKSMRGYGTCGLHVNMPSACPYSSVEMNAHKHRSTWISCGIAINKGRTEWVKWHDYCNSNQPLHCVFVSGVNEVTHEEMNCKLVQTCYLP